MGEPFSFDFRTRSPSDPLDLLVESVWYARGTVPYERERIAPTGSAVAVFVLGDPIVETADNGAAAPFRADTGFLTGPHVAPAVNEPLGETFAVGIVATPVGCESLFGVAPATLRGRVVDLVTAWPAADQLRRRLLSADDPEVMLDQVLDHLHQTHAPPGRALRRAAEAVALLEEDPCASVASVAERVGLSHGHLIAELNRLVGLTPGALSRLFRMRVLLSRLEVGAQPVWSDEAADLGWFDQAHMIRDFKRHTGVTPGEYLAARRAVYADDQGVAGFVPDAAS